MSEEIINVEKGSSNIFKDLKMPNPAEYLAKTRLALIIEGIISEGGLRQHEASKILELNTHELSSLLDGFFIDHLFSLIRKLDCEVEIVVRGKPTYKPYYRN